MGALTVDVSRGEPRIMDIRLAEALGYTRPRRIRQIITRHEDSLMALGPLHKSFEETAGRPAETYWLNKSQAMRLCTFAGTKEASGVIRELLDLFEGGTTLCPQARTKPLSEIADEAPVRPDHGSDAIRQIARHDIAMLRLDMADEFRRVYGEVLAEVAATPVLDMRRLLARRETEDEIRARMGREFADYVRANPDKGSIPLHLVVDDTKFIPGPQSRH